MSGVPDVAGPPTGSHRFCALAVVFLLAVACWGPSPAAAQPVPVTGAPLEVQLWPGGMQGYTLFIVTGTLPETTELPAVVHLPFPPGAQVIWSGEVLGGPLEFDPEREHRLVEGVGGGALEIVAEDSLVVQYEAVGPALATSDGLIVSEFTWVQSTHAAEVYFSVRMPASAESVRIEPVPPGPPLINEAGERLYTLTPVTLAEGTVHQVAFAYGARAAVDGDDGRSNLIVGLIGALALALSALIVVYVRDQRRAGSSEVENA